jgi:hypothetical protein
MNAVALLQLNKDNFIDVIYARLCAKYTGNFTRSFQAEGTVDVWKAECAHALRGATARMVNEALDLCDTQYPTWPPQIPELRALVFKRIDPETAYYEAVEQVYRRKQGADRWSSRAVFWSMVRYGESDLVSSSWATAKSRWTKLYEAALKEDLPEIPQPLLALPLPGKTTINQEEGRRRAGEILATLTGKMVVNHQEENLA